MKTIKWIGVFLCLSLWAAAQISLAQTSTVVIAEIMYDNPLQDNEAVRAGVQGEFLSLYNYGEEDVNIGGWRVVITDLQASISTNNTYTIPSGTMLPGMSLAIIASRTSSLFNIASFYSADETEESGIVLYTSSLAFPDTRSKMSIYNAQSVLEDEVTYDGKSTALSGQILLRATNNVDSRRPISQTRSIQRQKIEVIEGNRVISRNDYYPAMPAHTVQLFEYFPESVSYSTPPTTQSSSNSETLSLSGTVTNNSNQRACRIESSQTISAGKTTYLAEEEIVLNPGFEVKAGTEFEATINRESFHHVTMLTYNLGPEIDDYCDHAKNITKSKAAVVSVQEVRRAANFRKLKRKTGLSGEMCITIYCVPDGPEWLNNSLKPIAVKYGIGMLWDPNSIGYRINHTYKIMETPNDRHDKKRAFMVAEFQDFCFVATHYSLNETHRLEMSDSILNNWLVKKCLNAGKPVYIAGDMNEDRRKESATAVNTFINHGFRLLNTPVKKDIDGRFIDLILEHNINPYNKTLSTGVPIDDFDQWNADEISDHYPYFVKVKVK